MRILVVYPYAPYPVTRGTFQRTFHLLHQLALRHSVDLFCLDEEGVAAPHIGAFIERHPTIKILALSFLMMVGLVLAADGLHFHVPKGYIYFAMAFSLGVEMINIRARRKRGRPVRLHNQPRE